jgi:hypothetical protein
MATKGTTAPTETAPVEQTAPTQEEFDALRAELDAAKAALARYQGRVVRITSPAGPVHVFRSFDDAGGGLVIAHLPEDEFGHWAPFYSLAANGQDLGAPEITTDGA